MSEPDESQYRCRACNEDECVFPKKRRVRLTENGQRTEPFWLSGEVCTECRAWFVSYDELRPYLESVQGARLRADGDTLQVVDDLELDGVSLEHVPREQPRTPEDVWKHWVGSATPEACRSKLKTADQQGWFKELWELLEGEAVEMSARVKFIWRGCDTDDQFLRELRAELVDDVCWVVSTYFMIEAWAPYKHLNATIGADLDKSIDALGTLLDNWDREAMIGLISIGDTAATLSKFGYYDASGTTVPNPAGPAPEAVYEILQSLADDLKRVREVDEDDEGPKEGRNTDDGLRWLVYYFGLLFDTYVDANGPTSQSRIKFVHHCMKLAERRTQSTIRNKLAEATDPGQWKEPWKSKSPLFHW